MRRSLPLLALLAVIPAGVHASPLYDQDVTPGVIYGSGNANGSYTVDRNNNVELGLRAKLRHNAAGAPENTFNSNGDGTYSFAAGVAPTQSAPTAIWSFDWSINTALDGQSSRTLSGLTYQLGIDYNPGFGTLFTTFDPINLPYGDHAIGNNATGDGDGTVAADGTEYGALISANNVAQNSWKPHWFIGGFGFDPTLDGTYDFYLAAFDGSTELARTSMQVIVGAGATAAVPAPAPLVLFGFGLLALGVARRRKA